MVVLPLDLPSNSAGPIITLTTDFGLTDHYVAALKAALLRQCPAARLVDVTHLIERHNVLQGSFVLERALHAFGPGTIHLAVIDPGVGTPRRAILIEVNGAMIVAPDNGLITWAWKRFSGGRAYEILWQPKSLSPVFHGRDLFAPVAGMLAAGTFEEMDRRRITDPILLPVDPASNGAGEVIQIDAFGNATTNIPDTVVKAVSPKSVRVGQVNKLSFHETYADVPIGQPLALIGSSGLLEIAVREGSAAEQLGIRIGTPIHLT